MRKNAAMLLAFIQSLEYITVRPNILAPLPLPPPAVFLITDAGSARVLQQFFDDRGYGWCNATGILTFVICDSSNGSVHADLAKAAATTVVVLGNCWTLAGAGNPRKTFETWYDVAYPREQLRREIPKVGKPATSTAFWPSAFAAWLMNGGDVDAGFSFVHHLAVRKKLEPKTMDALMYRLRSNLTTEQQRVAYELITHNGFMTSELNDPSRIIEQLTRSNWSEVWESWQQQRQNKPFWRDVAATLERNARRSARPPKNTPATPPFRDPCDTVTIRSSPKEGDPLIERVKGLLPRKMRDQAANIAEAIRALNEARTALDVPFITAEVCRRRRSAGGSCKAHVIAASLPLLARHGYVFIEGDKARIRPGALV